MAYDSSNVFAKILRGEIPCKKVHEDEFALAFKDIAPQAPTHVVVIPKGPYVNFTDFVSTATAEEVAGFQRAILKTIAALDGLPGGFRLISNSGADGGQEVPHYHVHILGGHKLGPMLSSRA